MDNNWILDLRDFLIETKSNMSIRNTWAPPLIHRANDRNLPPKHLRIFNNWRLFFQVIRMSDMTNAKGDKLDQKYVQYNASTNHSNQTSRPQWPRQDKPNIVNPSLYNGSDYYINTFPSNQPGVFPAII